MGGEQMAKKLQTEKPDQLRRSMLVGGAATVFMPQITLAQGQDTVRIGVPTKTYWPTIICETAIRQKLFDKEGIKAELTMPILLETLRISMIFNFTGVMIAEMYASRTGIGHLIAGWGENFQMPQLFAGVIMLATVAILFNETVRFLEVRCSTWRT
jgi:hypothetical protein